MVYSIEARIRRPRERPWARKLSTCHETDHNGRAVAAWAGGLARCEGVERCPGVNLAANLERAGWWVGGFPVMMLVLGLFLDASLFVSQFHHGCDALTALLLYRSLAGVGCLTVHYQRPSWFLPLAYLLILEHFLNRWLLMLVSIESKVFFHPIATVWISSGCVICESRNNNQDVYNIHK